MDEIIELNKQNVDFVEMYYVIKDSFYKPNLDKVIKKIEELINDNRSIVFGYFKESKLVGSIVIEITNNEIIVKYIGVRENSRHNDIGSSLIKYIIDQYQLICFAETDNSAVGFYRKCGFECTEIIKEYGNNKVKRFSCRKKLINNY